MEALLEAQGIDDGYVDCQGFPCFVALPGSPDSDRIRQLRDAALEAFGPGIVEHVGQSVGDTGSITSMAYLPEDVPVQSVRRELLERATVVSMLLRAGAREEGAEEGGAR